MTNTTNLLEFKQRAINAHNGTSFSPEKRGETMISQYSELLASDLKLIEAATDEVKNTFVERWKKYFGAYLAAKSRIVSTMIAGGSNFPVARMEKYNRWERSAYEAFDSYRDKSINAILKGIERAKPEEVKQAEAWQSIQTEILDKCQTIMEIDNGINTYTSRQLIVANLTGFITRIANNGQTEHLSKALDLIRKLNSEHIKPIVTEKNAIFSLADKAQAVAETKRDQAIKENQTATFEGGTIVFNYSIDRLQIIHDTKPDFETISLLKKAAFKWSPSNKAWQRQLTQNAIYAAKELLKKLNLTVTV